MMKNRILTVLTLIVFVLTGCLSEPAASTIPDGYNMYKNKESSFRLWYPEEWEVKENWAAAAVIITSPVESEQDNFRENLNVIVEPNPEKVSFDQLKKNVMSLLERGITQFELVSSEERESNGKPSIQLVYNGVQGIYHITYLQTIVWDEDQSYYITFVSTSDRYEKYVYRAKTMMSSFQID